MPFKTTKQISDLLNVRLITEIEGVTKAVRLSLDVSVIALGPLVLMLILIPDMRILGIDATSRRNMTP